MRHSTEIEESIRKLEEDKNQLVQVASLLKSVGESIFDFSNSLINLSNLLFEGYSVGNKRIDGNLYENAEEYKSYSEKLLALADMVAGGITVLDRKIANEEAELVIARQREAEEAERQRQARIRAAQRNKEEQLLSESRFLTR